MKVDRQYLKKMIMEEIEQETSSVENPIEQDTDKKPVVVKFDTSTSQPWEVKFTERGFVVDGTRLSFEFIEDALSKEVNLIMNNGKGMILDAVKLQKILKYKGQF